MVRRAIRTDRLIAVLGVVVIVLGALAIWFVTRGSGGGFTEEPTSRPAAVNASDETTQSAAVETAATSPRCEARNGTSTGGRQRRRARADAAQGGR